MKTFISTLTLAFTCLLIHPNLHAQNDTDYVIVEYMKVKPGMSEDRIGQKIEATRSIYKTEVRRLVDFVE